MSEFEEDGFRGLWLPGRRLDGGYGVALIAKRRFVVDTSAARCVPDEETPPFVLAPEYLEPDDPMSSSIANPSEIALQKPKVDVIVQGVAHSPGGKPKRSFDVRVRIAEVLDHSLRIFGPRKVRWVAPKKKLTKKQREQGLPQVFPPPEFGQAKTITSLPLTYEYAYGGAGALIIDAHIQEAADKHQEEAQAQEERRQRKREIEAELIAEEEALAAEKAEQERLEAGGLKDAEAREKFSAAFGADAGEVRDGVLVLDDAERARLESLEAEAMVESSPMRLRAGEPSPVPNVEPSEEEGEGEGEEEAGGKEERGASGTAILDISELDSSDELKGVLEARDAQRRRELRDREGTLIARVEGMDEVALSDDAWIESAKGEEEPASEPEEESPYPMIPNLANPAGRGYCVSPMKEAVDGLELPCIEHPERLLTPERFVKDLTEQKLDELEAAAGLGAYAPGWFPRARLAGVLPWDLEAAQAAKEKALEGFDPDDPDDQASIEAISAMDIPLMQAAWYQEANPDMQVEAIKGDEEVFLDGFSPSGPIFFRLPGLHPRATIDLGEGEQSVLMRVDTLTIDASAHEAPVVTLLWRGWLPLPNLDLFDEVSMWGSPVSSAKRRGSTRRAPRRLRYEQRVTVRSLREASSSMKTLTACIARRCTCGSAKPEVSRARRESRAGQRSSISPRSER